MKNIFKYGFLCVAAAAMMTACDDWTEPESVGNKFESAGEVNPEVYAKYLAGLRSYRTTSHAKAYAWYANQAAFSSQAHHISALPDSIDVAVLTNPLQLNDATLNEMAELRADKGMQFAAPIDVAAIKKAWTALKEAETAGGAAAPEWTQYLGENVQQILGVASNFDRVVVMYDGREQSALTAAEQAADAAEQKAVLDPVVAWTSSNNKGLDFVGIPVNIIDKSVLSNAGIIFLSESAAATNANEFAFIISRNSVSGVPTDRFAVMSYVPVLDPAQAAVGYWGKKLASHETARWAAAHSLSGLGLVNIADDYYNPTFIYPVTRTAIQVLNPSAF